MSNLENWREEKRSAYLYRQIAISEKNAAHKKLFLELSTLAEKQASIWEVQLKQTGDATSTYQPDLRVRIVLSLVRVFGARVMRLALAALKVRGMSIYRLPDYDHEAHLHRNIKSGGNIRAAVFGISDGLLSNACLILGVAGAQDNPKIILLTGVAGLLAGAFSMGSGEYVSVKSQREMLEYQLALEKHELDTYPEEEAEELSVIYQARGLPKLDADKLANLLIQDPEKALDTLAREELGVNPQELGSPSGAAISSFVSFIIGAAVPLLPYLFGAHKYNLAISIGLTASALFIVGALLSLFTQKNSFISGCRMLLIGTAVGSFTYLIGSFLGVHVH